VARTEATVPHFERTGPGGGLTTFQASVEALRPVL